MNIFLAKSEQNQTWVTFATSVSVQFFAAFENWSFQDYVGPMDEMALATLYIRLPIVCRSRKRRRRRSPFPFFFLDLDLDGLGGKRK